MTGLISKIKKTLSGKDGIAIILVLSAVSLMTLAIVDFMADSRIEYKVAVRNKERLQAYYLARSALSFSEIILKYQKEFESQLANVPKGGEDIVKKIKPLYRMIPLNSNLFRGLVEGEKEGGQEESPDKEKDKKSEDKEDKIEDNGLDAGKGLSESTSFLAEETAKEFLDFDGDFSSEISEEQIKLNINSVYGLEKEGVGGKTYNRIKRTLFSILSQPKFKELFKDQNQGAENLTHAIADWIDQDDTIDEFDENKRGSESGLYGGADYKVKNGKMLTLSELRLVAGMNDEIYKKIAGYLTIYGTGNQQATDGVNVCLSEKDDFLKSLIYEYTHFAGCETRPIEFKDKEKMDEVVNAILTACPNPTEMASALYNTLGISAVTASPTPVVPGAPSTGGSIAGSGCQYPFDKLLTKDNRVFSIKATGTVGDTEVTINSVLNIDPQKTSDWKYYYYRIE